MNRQPRKAKGLLPLLMTGLAAAVFLLAVITANAVNVPMDTAPDPSNTEANDRGVTLDDSTQVYLIVNDSSWTLTGAVDENGQYWIATNADGAPYTDDSGNDYYYAPAGTEMTLTLTRTVSAEDAAGVIACLPRQSNSLTLTSVDVTDTTTTVTATYTTPTDAGASYIDLMSVNAVGVDGGYYYDADGTYYRQEPDGLYYTELYRMTTSFLGADGAPLTPGCTFSGAVYGDGYFYDGGEATLTLDAGSGYYITGATLDDVDSGGTISDDGQSIIFTVPAYTGNDPTLAVTLAEIPFALTVDGTPIEVTGTADGFTAAAAASSYDGVPIEVAASYADGTAVLTCDDASVNINGTSVTFPNSNLFTLTATDAATTSTLTIIFTYDWLPDPALFAVTVNGSAVTVTADTSVGADFPAVASAPVSASGVTITASYNGTPASEAYAYDAGYNEVVMTGDGNGTFTGTLGEGANEVQLFFAPTDAALLLTITYTAPAPPVTTTPVVTVPVEEEAIRVSNELDEEDISSDTTLWPNNTTERSRVSTTTVSDRELEALLELAKAHEEDTDSLEGDGLKEAIIVLEDNHRYSNNKTYILILEDDQVETLEAEGWDLFTVRSPIGDVSVYTEGLEVLAKLSAETGDELRVILSVGEHEGRPAIDVTLMIGETEVTFVDALTLPYGIRLFIPYQPAGGEDINALLAEYLPEDGDAEAVTESCYDAALGGIVLHVGHLSKFGVAYRPAAFSDVGASHWANPYVTFLAARGVLSGETGGKFRPDDAITRAEFAVLAAAALSAANLPDSTVALYSDVPVNSEAALVSNWLYYNNLAGSITTGDFLRPDEAITREDMAALLSGISSGVGLRMRSKGLDAAHLDAAEIASYAQGAVARLRAAGVLEMPESYRFYPKSTLNRGEAAQIIATLLSNI